MNDLQRQVIGLAIGKRALAAKSVGAGHLAMIGGEDHDRVARVAPGLDGLQHAADRQEFIDQAQSLNLFFRPDSNIKYIHAVHFTAWKKGVKTLYYCRSEKIGKADKVAKKIEREVIKELDMEQVAQGNDCIACEG